MGTSPLASNKSKHCTHLHVGINVDIIEWLESILKIMQFQAYINICI